LVRLGRHCRASPGDSGHLRSFVQRRLESLHDRKLDHARAKIERAAVVELAVAFYVTCGQCARAVEIGLSCLRSHDIDLPLHPTEAQIEEETEDVWQTLGDRAIEDLIHLPSMSHPEIKAVMDVSKGLAIPAFCREKAAGGGLS
jgi:predicted ATPase